jgi:hypothetical protein
MLLPLATIVGLTGCSYVLGPAVSERPALPAATAGLSLLLNSVEQARLL